MNAWAFVALTVSMTILSSIRTIFVPFFAYFFIKEMQRKKNPAQAKIIINIDHFVVMPKCDQPD